MFASNHSFKTLWTLIVNHFKIFIESRFISLDFAIKFYYQIISNIRNFIFNSLSLDFEITNLMRTANDRRNWNILRTKIFHSFQTHRKSSIAVSTRILLFHVCTSIIIIIYISQRSNRMKAQRLLSCRYILLNVAQVRP